MRLLAAAALVVGACSGRPSAADCGKAADHMIAIFTAPVAGESGNVAPEVNQASEAWKKSLLKDKDPTREALVNTCQAKMAGGHIECILGAVDETSLARCFGG